jgi:hypothetical protein
MSSTANRRLKRRIDKDVRKGIIQDPRGYGRELQIPTVQDIQEYIKSKIEEPNVQDLQETTDIQHTLSGD